MVLNVLTPDQEAAKFTFFVSFRTSLERWIA